jgi:hypothetical protein
VIGLNFHSVPGRPMKQKRTNSFRQRALTLCGALAATTILGAAMPAAAQGFRDAPVLFLDVSTGLSYETFSDARDDEAELTTRLGVGYFTSTDRQRLSFETGVTLRAREEGHDLIDPFADISYARFSRGAEIGGRVTFRRSEVDGGAIDDDFDADDLDRESGTREDIGLRLNLVTGRASPFGTDTELRYDETNYFDGATSDDRRTHELRSTLRFTIDPQIELGLTGFWRQRETDNAAQEVETISRVTFGADLAIDRAWSSSVEIGYAEIETETTGGVAVESGMEAAFLLTRDLRNGELSFSSDHVITDDGWRNSVRIRRIYEISETDRLNVSVGQIFFEEGGSGHLASLDFDRRLRFSALSLGLNYTSDLDAMDMLIQRVRADFDMRFDVSDNSSIGLGGSLASVSYDNPATVDALRADVGISYRHALANDWNVVARAAHRVLYEDGDVDERSNLFSLNLERRFSVRP